MFKRSNMTDWCLYGEAVDAEGEFYAMAPDIVIVNVPKTIIDRKGIFRFLKNTVDKKEIEILSRKFISKKYWGTMKLYTRWGKLLTHLGFHQKYYQDRLTLINLARETPADLKKGFLAFGNGFLVRYYDWNGGNDEDLLKIDFAIRHPDLAGTLKT